MEVFSVERRILYLQLSLSRADLFEDVEETPVGNFFYTAMSVSHFLSQ